MCWIALCLILSLFVQSSPAYAAEKIRAATKSSTNPPDGVTFFNPPMMAPYYEFRDEADGQVTLTDFRGRFILLNIWATWCGPCVQELPHLQTLQNRFSGNMFEVVTVAIDRNPALVPNFLREENLTLAPFTDAKSFASKALSVSGLPTTFLINPDGFMILRGIGGIPWSESPYIELIEQALAAHQGSSSPKI